MAMISVTFERFLNALNDNYEPDVHRQLANVYMILSGALASIVLGAFLQISDIINLGTLAKPFSWGLAVVLYSARRRSEPYFIRLPLLIMFGFCCGQSVPLMYDATHPLVVIIFITAVVIFIFLSLGAVFEPGRQILRPLILLVIAAVAANKLANLYFDIIM